jgi:hypothetical protein
VANGVLDLGRDPSIDVEHAVERQPGGKEATALVQQWIVSRAPRVIDVALGVAEVRGTGCVVREEGGVPGPVSGLRIEETGAGAVTHVTGQRFERLEHGHRVTCVDDHPMDAVCLGERKQ